MHQADETLAQAAPVQNTWYTVMDEVGQIRLIAAEVVINGDTGETIEMRVIIDGNTYTTSGVAMAGHAHYQISQDIYLTGMVLSLSQAGYHYYRPFLLEGRDIQVQVRKTTANGADEIDAACSWARW